MPFALIPTALGVCFFLVWAFICGMVLRDGQLAAERRHEDEGDDRARTSKAKRKAA